MVSSEEPACTGGTWLKAGCIGGDEISGGFFCALPGLEVSCRQLSLRVVAPFTSSSGPALHHRRPPLSSVPSRAMDPRLTPDELDMIMVCAAKKMNALDICKVIPKRRASANIEPGGGDGVGGESVDGAAGGRVGACLSTEAWHARWFFCPPAEAGGPAPGDPWRHVSARVWRWWRWRR